MTSLTRWLFSVALVSMSCGGRTGGVTGGATGGASPEGTTLLGGSGGSTGPAISTRSCVDSPTRDVACPGPGECLTDIDPAYVLMQDQLNGSSVGKLVGTPLPEFTPAVVGQGVHPVLNSDGSTVRYTVTPKASGTLSFWVKVIAPLEFYKGPNIGLVGREIGDCNDFFMQIQSNGGMNVAIQSASGGTRFRDVFPSILTWTSCATHHLILTWGGNESPELYIDGVWSTLSGAALPYLPACDAATSSLLFGASRELYASSYSPGPLVFDELLLLSRSLTKAEKGLVAVDDACPCPGPTVGAQWAGPQTYLDCVSQMVTGLVALGRLDRTQADGIATKASQSLCGSRH